MYIFFDTETDGLPDMKAAPTADGQPHICQLGAVLCDEHGYVKAEVNLLVRPDGWVIPPATTAIHGISQDAAERYGLPIKVALAILARLSAKAKWIVAHNIRFDLFLLEIESRRLGVSLTLPGRRACTMADAKDVLRLPPTSRMVECGMTEFKKPNLQEAYHHFFGKNFEGAHDAMADVRACRDVFFALQRLKLAGEKGAAA